MNLRKIDKKLRKRIIAGLLAMCLTGLPPVSAIGAVKDSMASYNADKEEIIYVMTDSAGKVNTMRAVNVFGPGQITDFGDYTDVHMMNTNADITLQDDEVFFIGNVSRVYYEGAMKDRELPWNIDIAATVDGTPIPLTELGGQTGHLILRLQITKNKECQGDWFDNYALQATLQLDGNLCDNIIAPDATVANVGLKKQLTYTVLPGKGLDTQIIADVTNFTMDGLSINGISLNLDVDFNDEKLMDKVRDMMDASVSLRDGAVEIHDGTLELKDGATDLKQGTEDLDEGARKLHDGAVELEDGIQKVRDGIRELEKKSDDLTKGSAEVKEALDKIKEGLHQVEINEEEIDLLTDASGEILTGITKLNQAAEELEQAVNYDAYAGRINEGLAEHDMTLSGLQDANTQIAETLLTVSDAIHGEQVQGSIEDAYDLLERMQQDPRYTSGSGLRFLMGAVEAMEAMEVVLNRVDTVSVKAAGVLQLNNGVMKGTETYLDEVHRNLVTLQVNIAKLQKSYRDFDGAILDLRIKLLELSDGMIELKDGINKLADEYGKLDEGIIAYTDGVKELEEGYRDLVKGSADLTKGCKELLEGADALYEGAEDLLNGVTDLAGGSGELADGTEELHRETGNMDNKIQQEIDDALGGITGGVREYPMSFTSEKNGKIKSLQFVIRTGSVNLPEEDAVPVTEAPKLKWWQKLLQLFGLWK